MRIPSRPVQVFSRGVIHLGALAAALLVAASATSAQDRPLSSFPLTRLVGGQALDSRSLVRPDHWVVVVVRPRCESCTALVRRLAADAAGREAGRILVVLSGMTAADAAAQRAAAPTLPPAAWLVDGAGTAALALGAPSTPLVVGLRGERVVWTLSGALFIDAQWEGVVVPWLR